MRKLIALAAASVTALALAAVPASAEDTTVTFTVAAGLLTLDNVDADATDDGNVPLGSQTSSLLGTTISGLLGTTTISDNRASLAGWTVSVAGTNFVSDQGTPLDATDDRTIDVSKGKLYNTVPVVVEGVAVVTSTHLDATTAKVLATTAASYMTATTTGSNKVTYDPTLHVTIDSTVIAGTYSGTVTQTVA